MNHLPHSFNAGCGGDKIENVLYRISEGLLEVMKEKKVLPKLWVVSVGTNNLRPKGRSGLRDGEVEAFLVLLSALLRAAPGSKVLMTELSYRTDIGDEIVDVVNEQMKGAVGDINAALERERVVWHSLPEIRKQEHLLDHVHFNEEGYMAWDEKLAGDVEVLVGEGTC
jgi:lysophospholipase L1-like esterase